VILEDVVRLEKRQDFLPDRGLQRLSANLMATLQNILTAYGLSHEERCGASPDPVVSRQRKLDSRPKSELVVRGVQQLCCVRSAYLPQLGHRATDNGNAGSPGEFPLLGPLRNESTSGMVSRYC